MENGAMRVVAYIKRLDRNFSAPTCGCDLIDEGIFRLRAFV